MKGREPDAQPSRKKQSSDPVGDTLAFCVLMHVADAWTRIDVVEHGVPARSVGEIAALMGTSLNHLAQVLGIPPPKLRRRTRHSKPLWTGASDRVVGMARLVGCAAFMVQQTGGPSDFDAGRWVASWLERPLPALGGRCPAEFMSTRSGQGLVNDLLERASSGAYS